MLDFDLGRPPFVVFLDAQLRRIRARLDAGERRIASAVSLGESVRRPTSTAHARRDSLPQTVPPRPPRHRRTKPAQPPSLSHDAPVELRGKRLRHCACGCGTYVVLEPGQDPRAAAFSPGHGITPNPHKWTRRRRIGDLTAAARCAALERSA